MAGPGQVRRPGAGVDGRLDRGGTIGGADACGHLVARFDGDAERGAIGSRVPLHHERNLQFVQTLSRHRQTNKPATVPGHEVDGLGGHLFRGHGQVAFVLPVLVVDDDHHAPAANVFQSLLDGGERHLSPPTRPASPTGAPPPCRPAGPTRDGPGTWKRYPPPH